jgi:hypothetical protein
MVFHVNPTVIRAGPQMIHSTDYLRRSQFLLIFRIHMDPQVNIYLKGGKFLANDHERSSMSTTDLCCEKVESMEAPKNKQHEQTAAPLHHQFLLKSMLPFGFPNNHTCQTGIRRYGLTRHSMRLTINLSILHF